MRAMSSSKRLGWGLFITVVGCIGVTGCKLQSQGLPTVKANSMSAISLSLGCRLVTIFNSARVTRPLSRVCTSRPPETAAIPRPMVTTGTRPSTTP